jgi:hypothetical protein
MSVNKKICEEAIPLIVVAGVTSGCGKTSVAEATIKWLSQRKTVAAGKITVTHGDRGCPHGGKSCNTCSSLGGDFQIIKKQFVINQEGTDTARFQIAGGKPTVWAITRDVAIKDAWREMKNEFLEADCSVVESNTLALITKPKMTLMVVDPTVSRKLWKPSAEFLIGNADLIIFNRRGSPAEINKTILEVEQLRNGLEEVIFVAHPHLVIEDEQFLGKLC